MDFGGGMKKTVVDTLRNENPNVRSTTNFYSTLAEVNHIITTQTVSGTGTAQDPVVWRDSAIVVADKVHFYFSLG